MNKTEFSSLPLSKAMLDNLKELEYLSMTTVQAKSLPVILKNQDVIVQAKTGSGKTAAFGIGLLTKLQIKKFQVQTLVLCPTRELADQVTKELRRLARFTENIKILTLCGGVAFGPQLSSLKHRSHVVVGTPGRILKHLKKQSLCLDSLETLVLDEADRMLDMGFLEDIRKVIAHAPLNRQTMLFSATYPDEILNLSTSIQTNASTIKTTSTESPNKITEYFYHIDTDKKLSTLLKIFAHYQPENVLIFCNTKIDAKELTANLKQKGIEVLAIHGDLEQYDRNDVLVQFSNRSCSVLVATDVAARGIDIKELAMVVNYGLPYDETAYIHRIGRTGRAGEKGVAITIYSGREDFKAEKYRSKIRHFENPKKLRDKQQFSLSPANITLVIEAGKKQKLRPGDILGALTGDAGIAAKFVGKIDIYERQSYVAIDRTMINQAFAILKNGTIKKRKFTTWVLP